MAGHSKWANIKHRKAAQDAKRGKVFTRLIREIVVAARQGGGTIEDNPRLRAVVDKALTANMKKDTIENAIARGTGSADNDNMEEVTYEGYAPGGVAILVEAVTDNRNRTVAEVRHAFSKRGGNLGTDGSVAYLFARKGQMVYAPGVDEERLMEVALEEGAEDIVSQEDGSVEVLTPWEEFHRIRQALEAAGLPPEDGDVAMIASVQVPLEKDAAEVVLRLIDALEDLDDVQNVYTNADIPESVMEAMVS